MTKCVKTMLRKYTSVSSLVELKEKEVQNMQALKDVCIQAQMLKANILSDMPKSPKDGMKKLTLPMIDETDLAYKELIEKEFQLTKQICELRLIKSKVDVLLDSIPRVEQSIIRQYYFEGLTLDEIAKKAKVTAQYISKTKNSAIKKMQNLLN
jgi:RNA polymerase sigma factor (sigma-70 family)